MRILIDVVSCTLLIVVHTIIHRDFQLFDSLSDDIDERLRLLFVSEAQPENSLLFVSPLMEIVRRRMIFQLLEEVRVEKNRVVSATRDDSESKTSAVLK